MIIWWKLTHLMFQLLFYFAFNHLPSLISLWIFLLNLRKWVLETIWKDGDWSFTDDLVIEFFFMIFGFGGWIWEWLEYSAEFKLLRCVLPHYNKLILIGLQSHISRMITNDRTFSIYEQFILRDRSIICSVISPPFLLLLISFLPKKYSVYKVFRQNFIFWMKLNRYYSTEKKLIIECPQRIISIMRDLVD